MKISITVDKADLSAYLGEPGWFAWHKQLSVLRAYDTDMIINWIKDYIQAFFPRVYKICNKTLSLPVLILEINVVEILYIHWKFRLFEHFIIWKDILYFLDSKHIYNNRCKSINNLKRAFNLCSDSLKIINFYHIFMILVNEQNIFMYMNLI